MKRKRRLKQSIHGPAYEISFRHKRKTIVYKEHPNKYK